VEQAVSANQSHVKCRGIKDVLVAALAPDVALSEFNGARVDYKDVKVIKQIGEGGFAKVYKVRWLTHQRCSTTPLLIACVMFGPGCMERRDYRSQAAHARHKQHGRVAGLRL
jgi:hypothetical protein